MHQVLGKIKSKSAKSGERHAPLINHSEDEIMNLLMFKNAKRLNGTYSLEFFIIDRTVASHISFS